MKRMPSRAAAIRELQKRGLSAEGFALAEDGAKSRDFGLIDPDRRPAAGQQNRAG
jgi:hypothetical protein